MMDFDVIHTDYVAESEEFFSNERKSMSIGKSSTIHSQLKRTVSHDLDVFEMPLFLRRQESTEDHRVPTLSNIEKVPSFDDLSDEGRDVKKNVLLKKHESESGEPDQQ